jgi:hypothetical protein
MGADRGENETMESTLPYDGDLQMFRQEPREINVARLRFVRWLVEQGRLEHPPAGPPSGELAPTRPTRPLREAA